jgi:methionyl-tRNA synthetase
MADNTFYITTPIYYVNFKPHIGTSYTTILTDVMSRVMRLRGREALLVTGSDEHSQNIADLAAEAQMTPRAYTDTIIPKFTECWELIQIQDYRFERTSDAKHHKVVQAFWQRLYDRGDVYKGEYAGWYHTSDNRYLEEDEVPENPEEHPRLKYLTEESYYFKLSAYQDWLLEFHEKNPGFVVPDFRRNEMLNRIKGGLKDICISRTSTDWGIPLPWDAGHVFYVWVDALLTYLTGSGFDVEAFNATRDAEGRSSEVADVLWETTREDLKSQPEGNHWPADLHVMAKDIPWFHAVIWPAMWASFGGPPPKQLLVHGYWQFDGEKMSKSLGNVVDPYDAAKIVGVDGLRYFLMREVPAGRDGNFNYEALISRYNYDLANDLGNLVHRTLSLLHQSFDGKLPEAEKVRDEADERIAAARQAAIDKVLPAYEALRFSEALQEVWSLVSLANKYVDEKKPWELKKKPEREGEIATMYYQLINTIRAVALLAYPVIPGAANRFWQLLGLEGTLEEQREQALSQTIEPGHALNRSEVVFQRVDAKVLAQAKGEGAEEGKGAKGAEQGKGKQQQGKKKKKKEAEPLPEGMVSIDDFGKLELRVAEIRAAEKVEKADKLLALKVFDGERERSIVAGIAKWYSPEELVGKRVTIVANLPPVKLRGVLSEGMVLAAEDGQGRLSVLSPEREVDVGTKVR